MTGFQGVVELMDRTWSATALTREQLTLPELTPGMVLTVEGQ